MKKGLLMAVISILILVIEGAFASEPTKEETFAFMKEKIDKYGESHFPLSTGGWCKEKITLFSLVDNGVIEFSIHQWCNDGSGQDEFMKIPLKELDPTTIKVYESRSTTFADGSDSFSPGWVTVECFKKKECIKYKLTTWKAVELERTETHVKFYLAEDEQLNKFAKALTHLVELYGGKGEIF